MSVAGDPISRVLCDPPTKPTFSSAQANRAVVLVRRIVADCVVEYSRLQDCHEAVEAAESHEAWGRWEEARTGLLRSAGRLRGYLEELHEVGVELRDWTLGVVDFPSVAEGRQVWLCWRLGEERVEWWHEGEDCAARRPITQLPTYRHPQPAFRRQ
jgi:hypothetical protein